MSLFNRVGKGLLALLPIIILIWIFRFVYNIFEGMFFYVFGVTDNNIFMTVVIFLISILFLYNIGRVLERNREFILLKITELLIDKIPIVKSVYSVIKEIVGMFSKKKDDSYLGVAYVPFGKSKIIGFITKKEGDEYAIFIPTTPNPTTGLLVYMKQIDVEVTDMEVSDGFKKIMSLGIK
ncbi:MAG: DUF502 domain-containing protein [Campylobacterales bacterium]